MVNLYKKAASYLSKRIAYKLFLIYLITISIPVSLFGILSLQLSSSKLVSDHITFKESLNVQISSNIDENLSNLKKQSASIILNINDISNFLSYPPKAIDDNYFKTQKRLNTYFLSILQNNERLEGIGLIQLNGDVVYYLDRNQSSTNLISVKKDKWFIDTLEANGDPVLLGPHSNNFLFYSEIITKNKDKVITYSRAIRNMNNDNAIEGILIFDQKVEQFGNLVANSKTIDGETLIILDKENNFVYANDLFIDDKTITEIVTSLGRHEQGSYKEIIGGRQIYISFNNSSQFGWKVVSLIPQNALDQKSAFLKSINLTLLIILVFLILIMSIAVSNIINHPLKKLMVSFKRLQEGNFDVIVPVKGENELAQIGMTFNKMVTNMKSLIEQKYELNILKKQAELESLQSQINPHFLYNTLSSAKAVIDNGDYKKASGLVQNLSDIFRYSLNRGKHIVEFSDELEHVKKYLYIQETRFSGKYEVCYDIDNEVMNLPITRLTLQPIVENAIYHGFEGKRENYEIKIAAKTFADRYFVYISDNGVGIPEDELVKINSVLESDAESSRLNNSEKVGIYNVNSRIKLHFGNAFGLKVFSTKEAGTVVRITLPNRE